MSVDVKLKLKAIDTLLKERNLQERGRAQIYIDNEVIRLMEKYTPRNTGATIDSAEWLTQKGSGLVKQGGSIAPWAKKNYNDTNRRFMGSPLRGAKHFERMKQGGGANSIFEGVLRMTGAKKK